MLSEFEKLSWVNMPEGCVKKISVQGYIDKDRRDMLTPQESLVQKYEE